MSYSASMKFDTKAIPAEAWVWILGLVGVAVLAPALENSVTFCIPSMLGFDWCLGCGLGRSIGHLVRGDIPASFSAHPLAVPAVAILTAHIFHLIRKHRIISRGFHG